MTEGAPAEGGDPLPFAVYAHVKAALAEELPLEEVLSLEGVEVDRWAAGEAEMEQRILEDPASFEAYRAELVEAEDRLGREVSPVDRDVEAWLALLAAYEKSPDPFVFLGDLGLRPTDLGRLGRGWERRIQDDATLEAQMMELRTRALPPVPPLKVGETPLVSSTGKRREASPATIEATSAPAADDVGALQEFGLERLAALAVELARWPKQANAVLARYGLDHEGHAVWLERFRAAFARDPHLERDYRLLHAHHERRLGEQAAPEPAPVPAPAARSAGGKAPASLTRTGPLLEVPRAPALPFAERPRPKRQDLAETTPLLEVPRGPTLPFGQDAEKKRAPGPNAKRKALSKRSLVGKTETLPHASPQKAVLPFSPSKLAKPRRWDEGSTVDLPAPPDPEGRAAASEKPPALTLEQHASLSVEIALAPGRTSEILQRYGLTVAQKEALDRAFEKRFGAAPELRATWTRAFETYRAWLAARR